MSDENVFVLNHPVAEHSLTKLRDETTAPSLFRELMAELTRFLLFEATRNLETHSAPVKTPFETKPDAKTVGEETTLVSIMRAGNGMLDGAMKLMPFSRVGHLGIYRDKFIKSTVEYFIRMPDDFQNSTVYLLDPLLATGETAVAAVKRLKELGVKKVVFVCILASPEGIECIRKNDLDIPIYCASVEKGLNNQGYILPGIGDAGNRLYGTHL